MTTMNLYRHGLARYLAQCAYRLPVHAEDWRTKCGTCRHSEQRPWENRPKRKSEWTDGITWFCRRIECQVERGHTSCSLARSSAGACGADAVMWEQA